MVHIYKTHTMVHTQNPVLMVLYSFLIRIPDKVERLMEWYCSHQCHWVSAPEDTLFTQT